MPRFVSRQTKIWGSMGVMGYIGVIYTIGLSRVTQGLYSGSPNSNGPVARQLLKP